MSADELAAVKAKGAAAKSAKREARLRAGVPRLRESVDAFCIHCIYDPGSGGGSWREQVGACTSMACPLWPHRVGAGEPPAGYVPISRAGELAAARRWVGKPEVEHDDGPLECAAANDSLSA